MEVQDIAGAIGQIKMAFDMFRTAIGLAKEVKDALPEGNKKKSIEESLEAADRAVKIAEAEIAKSLGYTLCQCTFPPQIMLSMGYDEYGLERFQCPQCKKIYPPAEEGPKFERLD